MANAKEFTKEQKELIANAEAVTAENAELKDLNKDLASETNDLNSEIKELKDEAVTNMLNDAPAKTESVKVDPRLYLATRKDTQTRIMFFGKVRFDMASNVITAEEYSQVKKCRDIKEIEKKILDIEEINVKSIKAIKGAIFDCEAKPAKVKAKSLLALHLELLEENN